MAEQKGAEQKKEEPKTYHQIKSEISEKKDIEDKLKILKGSIEKTTKEDKSKVMTLYGKTLLEKAPVAEYSLVYDSLSEGLEPIYFWFLDFMHDESPGGQGLEVRKGLEQQENSVSSGYFGEIGMRMTSMQKQAAEYLGAINQVIKSIINIIYDLKEFEIRIKMYDDLGSENKETRRAASYALKGIWMDQVDIRKGKGSINLLAQDLSFVTLRDAFFVINEINMYKETDDAKIQEEILKEVERLDLNDRVKNILRRKLYEYMQWKVLSEKEIKNRFNVERAYLKSQYGTLKLYSSWVKPYLVAAQKLKMTEFNTPDIVAAFSNMEMHLNLIGKKQVPIPKSKLHPSYKFIESKLKKYFYVLMVEMKFRSLPTAVQGQGGRHYIHGGKTEIKFKSFVFTEEEIKAIDEMEIYEDLNLVEEWVGASIDAVKEDLDRFLKDEKPSEKKEEKKEKKKHKFLEGFDNPFEGIFPGTGSLYESIKDIFKTKPPEELVEKEIEDAGTEKAKKLCLDTYNLYKKTHGMLSNF